MATVKSTSNEQNLSLKKYVNKLPEAGSKKRKILLDHLYHNVYHAPVSLKSSNSKKKKKRKCPYTTVYSLCRLKVSNQDKAFYL